MERRSLATDAIVVTVEAVRVGADDVDRGLAHRADVGAVEVGDCTGLPTRVFGLPIGVARRPGSRS
jgi:hypothetical protein